MNIFEYVRKNGIKRVFQVFYRYKIDKGICKIIKKIIKNKPLKDIIIIESHNDFDCNGGALYEHLIKNKYNKKYKIVWMLKNECKEKLPYNVEAYYMYKPSLKKNLRLCTAKYIFMDNNIFDRMNDNQKLIYCTHGVFSLKNTKGYIDIPPTINYFLGMSDKMDWYFKEQKGISSPTEILHIGHPIQDILLSNSNKEYMKISKKKYDKKIMWMPTFRKGGGLNRNDSTQEYPLGVPLIKNINQFECLDNILKDNNILLLIKLHPMQDKKSYEKVSQLSNIIMLDGEEEKKYGINKYRLMNESDALISDYSGAAYEYLLLNRPIGFVLNDVKDYKIGFSVENIYEYLPGHKIYNYQDFIKFIDDIVNNNDTYLEDRTALLNMMYSYKDSDACEEIIKKLEI